MKLSGIRMIIREEMQKIIKEYTRYKGDPIWIKAKYSGTDMNGRQFKKGEDILYYPKSPKGKNIISGEKAKHAYKEFVAAAEDEDIYMSGHGV